MNKPHYKTWIRVKKIMLFALLSAVSITIALLPISIFIRILFALSAIPFVYITFIISYSYYQFSVFGGNFQNKIHNLLVSKVSGLGPIRILDIGVGSGSLITKLALKHPTSDLVGIDYFGDDWEYSKAICEENAYLEGVSNRIQIVKGTASKLPFKDNDFDCIVSCLTFHEVKDELDKIKVIKEALRVLKNDGEFVFMDLFLDEKFYGNYETFVSNLHSLQVKDIQIVKLSDLLPMPKMLLHPKVLGNAMVLTGRKNMEV